MKRSTMILIAGAALSVGMAGLAIGLSIHRSSTVDALQARCEAEADSEAALKNAKTATPTEETVVQAQEPWANESWRNDRLVCDPYELLAIASELQGVQAEIAAAHKAQLDPTPWILGSALLLVASALPWFWYFLLRRLAEVRAAIGGNPPDK